MTAHARPAPASTSLVVGTSRHRVAVRSFEVVFTERRAPAIDLRRERDGVTLANTRLHADSFCVLVPALRAALDGDAYAGSVDRLQFDADSGRLAITIVGSAGRPLELRGHELVLLSECVRLARHAEDR